MRAILIMSILLMLTLFPVLINATSADTDTERDSMKARLGINESTNVNKSQNNKRNYIINVKARISLLEKRIQRLRIEKVAEPELISRLDSQLVIIKDKFRRLESATKSNLSDDRVELESIIRSLSKQIEMEEKITLVNQNRS